MATLSFPEIDTSYWNLDDKAWVTDRKVQWSKIEPMFKDGAAKSKKGLGIIKKYFLKGEMPDFKALQDWSNMERHLDIFCFIWLHPESDDALLKELRDAYVNSSLIIKEDVSSGLAIFKGYSTIYPSGDYTEDETCTMLNSTGQNELLFRVLMGDLSIPDIPENGSQNWSINKMGVNLASILTMTHWLCSEEITAYNEECLYQSDLYLDYWFSCCSEDEGFFKKPKFKRKINPTKKALYRIHYFDTEKEGDTCRTRFVHKIRKILDERDFIPDFKQMWLDVKSGKTQVENAWER